MNTIYLVGEPGVGKSTFMAHLTKDALAIQLNNPMPHVEYEGGIPWLRGTVAQLGKDRTSFSGTDALSMGIQEMAVEFVKVKPYDWLLCEGDRLSNDAFFAACRDAGRLFIFWLTGEQEAEERRLARGSHQNESWVAGRRSKVQNLMTRWPHTELDAKWSSSQKQMTMEHILARGVVDA